MKYFFRFVLTIAISIVVIACSDDSNNTLEPPDFSPYIIGTWTGNTLFLTDTMTIPDTLFFEMTLDGDKNIISGESDFTITPQPMEVLDVTGEINYPSLSLEFLSNLRSFSFSGQFSATNSNIIMGTLQNQKYGSLPITFSKK